MRRKIVMLASNAIAIDPRVSRSYPSCQKTLEVEVRGFNDEATFTEGPHLKIIETAYTRQGIGIFLKRLLLEQAGLLWQKRKYGALCTAMLVLLLSPLFIVPLLLEKSLKAAKQYFPSLHKKIIHAVLKHEALHEILLFIKVINRFFMTCPYLWEMLKNRQDINIIYANDFDTLIPAVWYKRKYPHVRLVYDCHEFFPHSQRSPSAWNIAFFEWLERYYIHFCDVVFTVSPMLAKVISNTYGIPVETVPNAAPLEHGENKVLPQAIANLLDALSDKTLFLYQGAYADTNGITEIINAWEQLPQDVPAALLLQGKKTGIFFEHLMARLEKMPCYKKTLFILDEVPLSLVITVAKHCDVGIIPTLAVSINRRYCCPGKISQYMQAGLALLSSHTEYIKFLNEQEHFGILFDEKSSVSTLAAITQFIYQPLVLKTCQQNAKRFAWETFNWDSVEAHFMQLVTGDQYGAAMPASLASLSLAQN